MPVAVEAGALPGPLCGFAGKLPARGDFVGAGLPRDFLDPWHAWQSQVIAGSRALMGESWLDAFLEAPVWRFHLRAGLCGPRAVIGLLLPSVDKVGRYFPLTFAALPAPDAPDAEPSAPAAWDSWLDGVEALGRLALDEDAPPDRLLPPPCPIFPPAIFPPDTSGDASLWWTDGGPRVEATRLPLPALPDAARFAAMLGHPISGHPAPTESAP